ncbi:MAG: vWA domain-containing protein [Verrucomicrobiales bacterium]
MGEVSIQLNPDPPKPRKAKKKRPAPSKAAIEKSNRRAMIGSIVVGSVVVHAVLLLLFGLWTVAKHFSRPEARFEMKKTIEIPPRTPEHKMNVAKHEAMAPKPSFNDKLVSTRPIEFALPDLPQVDMDQMLPLDPSELISDQVSGLVGSAALGSGLGQGFAGGGGTGEGMSFFGVRAEGDRILLLFDVSASVVNKAEAAGLPLERIQEETIKLIETLPISSQFSLIQFTGNYMPFTEELIAATPGNKKLAREWVEEKWVTAGSMSSSASGVVRNLTGVVGVLERGLAMRPEVIFLISDASFQWRPDGGSGYSNVPYEEIAAVVGRLKEESGREVPVHFIAFEPKDDDAKKWGRIVRRTGGEFRELKEN